MDVDVAEIQVGKRHRKDLGDVAGLAESMTRLGLLQPVVLTADRRLIAGQRRVEAAKWLGWTRIPALVAKSLTEAAQLLEAERDENTCRKDFAITEAMSLNDSLLRILEPEAKERQRNHGGTAPGRKKTLPGTSRKCSRAEGEAKSLAAKAIGMDRRTADKAREVIASGDSALIAEMDRTGKVNGVYKKMQTAKTAELIRNEPPPLPSGPFRVIVADPPWQYDKRPDDPSHRGSCPYPMMRVEEIAAMPVKAIAHQDAVLWLWVTNAHLPVVWPIVAAWGFTYKTLLTWVKDKMGLGDWLRGQTEHCLLCVRGRPAWGLKNETTVLHAKNLGHSIKPDAFYAMVEELCPGAKVELFARKNRDGWTSHGGELPVA